MTSPKKFQARCAKPWRNSWVWHLQWQVAGFQSYISTKRVHSPGHISSVAWEGERQGRASLHRPSYTAKQGALDGRAGALPSACGLWWLCANRSSLFWMGLVISGLLPTPRQQVSPKGCDLRDVEKAPVKVALFFFFFFGNSTSGTPGILVPQSGMEPKEIKLVHPKGNQPRIFIRRTDADAEAPILCPPDAKSQFTGKDPDAGKDWGQEEKEDGWHGWMTSSTQ